MQSVPSTCMDLVPQMDPCCLQSTVWRDTSLWTSPRSDATHRSRTSTCQVILKYFIVNPKHLLCGLPIFLIQKCIFRTRYFLRWVLWGFAWWSSLCFICSGSLPVHWPSAPAKKAKKQGSQETTVRLGWPIFVPRVNQRVLFSPCDKTVETSITNVSSSLKFRVLQFYDCSED